MTEAGQPGTLAPNAILLSPAKRRVAKHLWMPSSFQPVWPVRTHPVQGQSPRVSPLLPGPLGSPEGLLSPPVSSLKPHVAICIKIKISLAPACNPSN